MIDATKQCRGCTARLLASDPDLCELCDLHRHDYPAGDVTEVRGCGNCGTELGHFEPGPRCTDCKGLRR